MQKQQKIEPQACVNAQKSYSGNRYCHRWNLSLPKHDTTSAHLPYKLTAIKSIKSHSPLGDDNPPNPGSKQPALNPRHVIGLLLAHLGEERVIALLLSPAVDARFGLSNLD